MGGLSVFWNPLMVKVNLIDSKEHWMMCGVSFLVQNKGTKKKANLWKELSNVLRLFNKGKIIMMGDFNAIMDLNEKRGGAYLGLI